MEGCDDAILPNNGQVAEVIHDWTCVNDVMLRKFLRPQTERRERQTLQARPDLMRISIRQ